MTAARPDRPPAIPDADLFAALPVTAMLVDPDGRIRRVNPAGELLLNWSDRGLRGQALAAVLPGVPDRAEDFAAFDTVIETARGIRLRADVAEAALPDQPGWRLVTLHATSPRQFDRAPGTRAAIGAAAMLAHEIRNPLSGIRGAAQLLGEGELPRLIIDEVDRIVGLIDRMEDFTDTRPLPIAPENIYPVLDHVTRIARAGFARDVVVEERFDPSLPAALANRNALIQVLLNLMKNAAEATQGQAARRIVLATAYRHGVTSAALGRAPQRLPIEIAVLDDGPGAPADIADHLFDPFVSGRPEGRGLGLALVDKLVRDMGGIVHHAREGYPQMTVFRLLLPRAA
ncbi:two-component system sensor histidine kinase NtrB [Sphingomonas bacterium]|uniref:two-component system sensor histidine kinase NtrB n=1 Tax=Sphingomonas bacterium TaxID=1895847 RepID=UPI001575EA14|nr:ATP-binding protein [Sphingomonas bacterium]